MTRFRAVVFWALVAGIMFLGLGRGLWTPDEPREAEMGREMALHPGFVPHLNARPFFEKPPLYYWMLALAYDAAGVSPATARAVSAVAGLATLALLFLWAKRAAGTGTAYRAVFLLATSVQFFQSTHWVLLDPLLMFLVTLALWGAWEALAGTPRRLLWLAAFYGGMSLALWSKGLVGMILPIGGLALFLLWKRKEGLPALKRLAPLVGLPFLVLFTGLCVGAFYLAEGWDAVYQLVWINHVMRLISPTTTGHAQPFYYYAQTLPVAVLPWLMPAVALARPRFWRTVRPSENADLRPCLGAMVAGGLVLLSLATTKRETYLLPLLPPLALLMALAWEDALSERAGGPDRADGWLFGKLQPVLLSLWGIAVPIALVVYTRSLTPMALLLGLLALAAGVAGVAWGFGGAFARAWEAHRVSAVILCVSVVVLAVPVAEPQKDMLPFARWVGFTIPGTAPIPALGADETLCGIIPFATGRTIEPLSAARWEEPGASGDGPLYLLEQRGADGPRGAVRPGYQLVREQRFGPGRTLRLWKRAPEMEPARP